MREAPLEDRAERKARGHPWCTQLDQKRYICVMHVIYTDPGASGTLNPERMSLSDD